MTHIPSDMCMLCGGHGLVPHHDGCKVSRLMEEVTRERARAEAAERERDEARAAPSVPREVEEALTKVLDAIDAHVPITVMRGRLGSVCANARAALRLLDGADAASLGGGSAEESAEMERLEANLAMAEFYIARSEKEQRDPPPNEIAQCRKCGATWTTGGDTAAFRCLACGASVAGPALGLLGGADGKDGT